MSDHVVLNAGGKSVVPPVSTNARQRCVDVSRLTGMGFHLRLASPPLPAAVGITYIDGEKGVLLYRGPIEQL